MKKLRNRKGLSMRSQRAISGYLFFLPWIIGFLLFTLYPILFSIQLSLNEVQLDPAGMKMVWKGLDYFNFAWNTDTTFKMDLSATVMMIACSTPVVLVFSLIIAMLLNKDYPLRTFFRMIFFFPVVIMSGPAISELLTKHSIDFSGEAPEIFAFIRTLPQFMQTPTLYILSNLVLILWFTGVQILIFLAGLQKISPDLYQAAEIDGAGAWEKFWKITLPFISPMILLCAIYSIIDIANYANNAVNLKIKDNILSTSGLYSFSAAMSWIYFAVILALLLAVYLLALLFGRRAKK